MTASDLSAAPDAPAPKRAPVWEDVVDVFYAPRAVFERRREGRYGLALLVYTILATVLFAFSGPMMQPIFDRQLDAQVEKARAGGASEQQVEQMRAIGAKTQGPVGIAFAALGTPITIFVIGLLLWGAGKMFGSTATYAQSTMVATYANVPRLLGMLLNAGLLYVTDPSKLTSMSSLTFSPARLLPAETDAVVLALLGRLDLFTIWVTVLLAIGLAVVGRLSRGQAFGAAAVVFVVATLGSLLQALRAAV